MNKKKLQEQELNSVAGGGNDYKDGFRCDTCRNADYPLSLPYPQGWYLSDEKSGCYRIYHYKCPNCGTCWNYKTLG